MTSSDLQNKPSWYYSKSRQNIIQFVPPGNNRVLDVGCGAGVMLRALRDLGRASEIVGIDIVDTGADLDQFLVGSIETMDLPFPNSYFDVITCADVLEHLVDPWVTLHKLVALLKPNGICIVSLPNFTEIKSLSKIVLGGRFDYTDSGILDRTHLRFFCKGNMRALIQGAGLTIEHQTYTGGWPRRLIAKGSFGILERYMAYQYIFACRKP